MEITEQTYENIKAGIRHDGEIITKLRAEIELAETVLYHICLQIERCGASEELTKASVMASELRQHLSKIFLANIGDKPDAL